MRIFLYCIVCYLIHFNLGCTPENESVRLPDSYNIVWDHQSKNSSGSMPLVGGDLGCNVWVENGNILIYAQKSGSLSENGEYLKLGRFRIRLDPNPFINPADFRQELKLEDGNVEIEVKNDKEESTFLKLWVDVFSSTLHVDIESDVASDITVFYENWRTEDKMLLDVSDRSRERFTCFNLEGYPGKVVRVKDSIRFTDHGILFYHRNPRVKLIPEILIAQQDLQNYSDEINDDIRNRTFGGFISGEGLEYAGTDSGQYQITPYKSWKLKSKNPGKEHHISMVSHIAQADSANDWERELSAKALSESKNRDIEFEKTISWWHEFWNRSHIFINQNDPDPDNPVWQMARNYQLFRYQLGGNVSGEYPTKFNGGNLIFDPVLVDDIANYDPDWRQWGGAVHTAQNQRLLYWPMLKSGDFDVILPQFELYRKGLPGATARVERHFGHKGAVFSEYMSASGVAMGSGWGWEGNGHRGRGTEIPFGDPRATGARGYNDLVEEGVMANQSIAYHWESQVEHAYMILEYHRFTGNNISSYIPFIKSALIFFDEHYQKRQKMRNGKSLDDNGKLVIYPSTACESYRGARNPSDLLAGLNACLSYLQELSEDYISSEEKKYFQEFQDRVPYYPFDVVEDLPVLKPAESWIKESNQELPQFYPLFPFNQFQIGDPEIQTFKNSYKVAPDFRKGTVISWHQDGIQFARMGMTNEAADYNVRKLQDSERRYPTFWGPGHDWVPDHNWGGSGMIGLQEMLMQTNKEKIFLFPAWPKKWDVVFKLHAPYKTTVEVTLEEGAITRLRVTPQKREKDIVNLLP